MVVLKSSPGFLWIFQSRSRNNGRHLNPSVGRLGLPLLGEPVPVWVCRQKICLLGTQHQAVVESQTFQQVVGVIDLMPRSYRLAQYTFNGWPQHSQGLWGWRALAFRRGQKQKGELIF